MLNTLKKLLLTLSCLILLSPLSMAADNPRVLLTTSAGEIEIELNAEQAPISTANFLSYVESGFYNNTIFHRVIPKFMIQAGGFTEDMQQKITEDPIKNEAKNGLKNERGTIAMARTGIVDSATSQFFINLENNTFLNNGSRDFGYAVFGKVVNGMEIVDKIAKTKTSRKNGHSDVPSEPIIIISAQKL